MWPSPLRGPQVLARPWRPLSVLVAVLLLAARPGAWAQATIDNNFGEVYGVGAATENCLNKAAAGCSGSTGAGLNSCLCRRDRFALESARCIARVNPADLDDVYFQMRANCLETGGFTLVVGQAEWVSAAAAATATTSSTLSSSSRSTSTPARTTTATTATPTATPTAAPTAGDASATGTGPDTTVATTTPTTTPSPAAVGGLDKGGRIGVGVGVAVGATLLMAGVFIWLKWRRRQREEPRYADCDTQIMESSDMVRTYPPLQAGPKGGMGADMYHKPPVGTASASTSPVVQASAGIRGGGGHWTPEASSFHPRPQQYTYLDHPSIAELGDGSDVTSHALSARDSARYSELPGGQSPLHPSPSSPSPVSPGPTTSPSLYDPRGVGPQSGVQG